MTPQLKPLLDTLGAPSLPGIDLSLERMAQLLSALGHPETKLPPVIHVAGTNGKGSTIAYLRAIYEAAGYHVHAYTSPHLRRFNERIVLAGHEASDAMLVPYLERVLRVSKRIPVTFFEATTAAAFLAFAGHKADIVLLETGLGGRLDATNMVPKPLATVITPISFDHQEYLGDRLEVIAAEKAGIIKQGVPVFCAGQEKEAMAVIKDKARKEEAPLTTFPDTWHYEAQPEGIALSWNGRTWPLAAPALEGTHQYANAALAAVTALALQSLMYVSPEHVSAGLAKARWPARLQRLTKGPAAERWKGTLWLDGGHNEAAAMALAEWLRAKESPVSLLVGMMQRKNAEAFFRPFAKLPVAVFCVPIEGYADAYSPDQLAKAAKAAGCEDVTMASSVLSAVDMASHRQDGVLLVTGSLFLTGELLKTHA